MISLKDLTIVIPFRYDSPDRLDNLNCVLGYFRRFFSDLDIVLIEDGPEKQGGVFEAEAGVRYLFFENPGAFHRTRLLNLGARMSERGFVAAYDADVVFRPETFLAAVEMLRSGDVRFVRPYSGPVFDVVGALRERFMVDLDFGLFPSELPVAVGKIVTEGLFCMHDRGLGGAPLFCRKTFLELGGYNERFISWGWEDNEIVHRFQMMGAPAWYLNEDYCFHLHHERGADSGGDVRLRRHNMREFRRVKRMSRNQLECYIETYLKSSKMVHVGMRRRGIFSRVWDVVRGVQCPHCSGKMDVDFFEV